MGMWFLMGLLMFIFVVGWLICICFLVMRFLIYWFFMIEFIFDWLNVEFWIDKIFGLKLMVVFVVEVFILCCRFWFVGNWFWGWGCLFGFWWFDDDDCGMICDVEGRWFRLMLIVFFLLVDVGVYGICILLVLFVVDVVLIFFWFGFLICFVGFFWMFWLFFLCFLGGIWFDGDWFKFFIVLKFFKLFVCFVIVVW